MHLISFMYVLFSPIVVFCVESCFISAVSLTTAKTIYGELFRNIARQRPLLINLLQPMLDTRRGRKSPAT